MSLIKDCVARAVRISYPLTRRSASAGLGPRMQFSTTNAARASQIDAATVSRITEQEKKLTGLDGPVKGGPTARAQAHATRGRTLDGAAVSDIAQGERHLTGADAPMTGGPAAQAQHMATQNVRRS